MVKSTLPEILAGNTKEGVLYAKLPGGSVRCFACGHRCPIPEGKAGVCRIRFNRDGTLYVPAGYINGLQDDPVEKKPFFHVLPGARALSFGMLGCDFHCDYCQNWISSQALRDPEAVSQIANIGAGELVRIALRRHCQIVVSTYNEPLITSEWAVEIFKEAKKAGLVTGYVSNGNATPEVLEYLKPWLDLYKVDLKGFDDRRYRELGGVLENVCSTIRLLHEMKFWVEIVTLLVPGFNDSDEEIKKLVGFIASVSPDIPWHVTAFHGDYKMTGTGNTTADSLLHAAEIGKREGLRFVYSGNLPGEVAGGENTYCPQCRRLLIERHGFCVLHNDLVASAGVCPDCHFRMPGVWG